MSEATICRYCGDEALGAVVYDPKGPPCCQAVADLRDAHGMLDAAREGITEALAGVPELDDHVGYWWHGAVAAIAALRDADRDKRYAFLKRAFEARVEEVAAVRKEANDARYAAERWKAQAIFYARANTDKTVAAIARLVGEPCACDGAARCASCAARAVVEAVGGAIASDGGRHAP